MTWRSLLAVPLYWRLCAIYVPVFILAGPLMLTFLWTPALSVQLDTFICNQSWETRDGSTAIALIYESKFIRRKLNRRLTGHEAPQWWWPFRVLWLIRIGAQAFLHSLRHWSCDVVEIDQAWSSDYFHVFWGEDFEDTVRKKSLEVQACLSSFEPLTLGHGEILGD